MRDVTIDQISDKVRAKFGLKVGKRACRKLARETFKYMLKVIATDKDRLVLRETDLLIIYKDYDIQEICGKLAEGDPSVPTYDDFNRTRRLKKIHKKYIRRPMYHNMRDPVNSSSSSSSLSNVEV